MKTKIFWNKAELAALRERLEEYFGEHPLAHRQLALDRAQEVLPEHRRRKLYTSAIHRYTTMIEDARVTASARRKLAQQAAKKAAQTPPTPAPQAPIAPALAPVAPPDLLRAVLEPILEALAQKVARRVMIQVAETMPGTPWRLKHNPEPAPSAGAPRTGVLVVGLLPAQAATIQDAFPELELTCLTSEEALKRDPLRRAHTILMTKFISHSVQDRYRKAQNLRLCNGGVSELAGILSGIQ